MTGVKAYLADRARRWSVILRLAPHGGRWALARALAVNLVIGAMPAVFVVAMGHLISRTVALGGQQDWSTGVDGLLMPFLVAVTAFVVQQFMLPLQLAYGEIITRRVDGYCIQRLMRSASADADIAALDRTETLDILEDARSSLDRDLPTPGDAVAGALALIARYGQLIGALALLGMFLSPGAAVVLGLTALTLRYGQRGSLSRLSKLFYRIATTRRGVAYVRKLASSAGAAKEIRVLGLLPWMRKLHQTQSYAYYGPLWSERWRISFRPFLLYAVIGFVGTALLMWWLATATLQGSLTVLAFAISVQAVLIPIRFAVFFPECDIQTQYGLDGYHAMLAFERQAAADARRRSSGAVPVTSSDVIAGTPEGPVGEVRFEDVHFRYTPDGPEILRGLDLELKPGTSTAIVGINGAGKTTLVKVLTRLYAPTSGRITVDGVPLSSLDTQAWQRRLAVIFQDYVRYDLSARDNIRIGAPDAATDSIAAAARRAGATSVLEALPDGPDTILSGRYPGGQDLSGGQWQRIALARAFFAAEHGASLLILDEPTAQLDVRAEVEFFDRFIEVTQGLTTVIISHRFSTVRRADQIVVIDGGRVTERGSHDELLARGGKYAELFRLQAQRFEEVTS